MEREAGTYLLSFSVLSSLSSSTLLLSSSMGTLNLKKYNDYDDQDVLDDEPAGAYDVLQELQHTGVILCQSLGFHQGNLFNLS